MLNKIDNFLSKYIHLIIGLFIILQPILDVIAGINQHFFQVNIELNIIFRIIFLLFCILFTIFINKTKYKRISLIYLGIIFIYSICFIAITIYQKDMSVLFYELKNLVLAFYFPILLISFLNLFEQYKINFSIKYLVYAFILYILFISIPNLTGTCFESYTQGKVGNSGWFNSANAISSIISILLPFIIIYLTKNKKISYLFLILLFLYSILSLGTKVPLLSLIIITFMNIIYLIIKLWKKNDYKKISLIVSTVVIVIIGLILIIPRTSFYKNIKIHAEFLGIESVSSIFTNIHYIDRFIFSDRLTFLSNTKKVYDKSSIIEKTFGIGYIENYATDEVSTKMIEIDYFDILFRHGIIGFVIFFMPIIILTYQYLRKYKNNFYNLNVLTSILLIYVLALFSGHIFNVPSVSIFVAIILNFGYFRNNQI